MRSSLNTRPSHVRRQHDPEGRGHVRPIGDSESVPPVEPEPVRMTPISRAQARSTVSVTRRRAERRARRRRVQAQHVSTTARRRVIHPAQFMSWRLVSGMMVIGLSIVLYVFLTADAFFVNSVQIGTVPGQELKYITRQEIFGFSNVAQKRLFSIDAQAVEARLEQMSNIADATVYVDWPPNMVQIIVTEREPALIWEQGGIPVWVDVNGIVMDPHETDAELLRVMWRGSTEVVGTHILPTWVSGALELQKYYESHDTPISYLLYDPVKGLGYEDPRHWTVWFGDGEEMGIKLRVYEEVVEHIQAQHIQPEEIVMSDPDRPYYRIWWREDG